jgi:hypothetical protein
MPDEAVPNRLPNVALFNEAPPEPPGEALPDEGIFDEALFNAVFPTALTRPDVARRCRRWRQP